MLKRMAFVASLLTCASAQATTVLYKNFNDLVGEATGIVEGTVANVASRQMGAGGIVTYVTLNGLKILKGDYQQSALTLLFDGGFVNGQGVAVDGSPEFKRGERVIAFVSRNGQEIVPLVGWGQGLFHIVKDAAGNKIVTDDLGNRVSGVRDGAVVKESKVTNPDMRIVGAPSPSDASDSPVVGRKESPSASAGVKGSDALAMTAEAASVPPMSYGQFVQAIQARIASAPAAKAVTPLVSVRFGEGFAPTHKAQAMQGNGSGAPRSAPPAETAPAKADPGGRGFIPAFSPEQNRAGPKQQ